MESEKTAKRSPRVVKPKKQEGDYETKAYVRRAVKKYEEKMRREHPERYEKLLQYQRDKYQEKKRLKQEQMKMQNTFEITAV